MRAGYFRKENNEEGESYIFPKCKGVTLKDGNQYFLISARRRTVSLI